MRSKGTSIFSFRSFSGNDIRAIQGHSGGELIDLELLNPVAIPLRCKEYLYMSAPSHDTHKDDKLSFFFFTPLDPADGETEEEYDDLTKPR